MSEWLLLVPFFLLGAFIPRAWTLLVPVVLCGALFLVGVAIGDDGSDDTIGVEGWAYVVALYALASVGATLAGVAVGWVASRVTRRSAAPRGPAGDG